MEAAGLFNLLFLMALVWVALFLFTSLRRLVTSVERIESLLQRQFLEGAEAATSGTSSQTVADAAMTRDPR